MKQKHVLTPVNDAGVLTQEQEEEGTGNAALIDDISPDNTNDIPHANKREALRRKTNITRVYVYIIPMEAEDQQPGRRSKDRHEGCIFDMTEYVRGRCIEANAWADACVKI